jgi:hypothetical protein
MSPTLPRNKTFLAAVLIVASFLLVWNTASALSGWHLGWLRVALNLAVIAAIFLNFRQSRLLVKIWAALPLISLGSFLLTSLLRLRWSPSPIEHLVGAALTLPIFLYLRKESGPPEGEA